VNLTKRPAFQSTEYIVGQTTNTSRVSFYVNEKGKLTKYEIDPDDVRRMRRPERFQAELERMVKAMSYAPAESNTIRLKTKIVAQIEVPVYPRRR